MTNPTYYAKDGVTFEIEHFDELELGETYLSRSCEQVRIVERDPNPETSYPYKDEQGLWYTRSGCFIQGAQENHENDLMHRVVNPLQTSCVPECDPESGNECKACYDGNLDRNMTKAQYIEFVKDTFESMSTLIAQKNSDYTAGVDDPFANFRISEEIGINPIAGLFLRMQDKAQRIKAWIKAGSLEVPGEGVEDAFRDFIGYSCLALGMLHEVSQRSSDCCENPETDCWCNGPDSPASLIPSSVSVHVSPTPVKTPDSPPE